MDFSLLTTRDEGENGNIAHLTVVMILIVGLPVWEYKAHYRIYGKKCFDRLRHWS